MRLNGLEAEIDVKLNRALLSVSVAGLAIGVIIHLNALFFSGVYQEVYGNLLFGIGFVALLFPLLYQTRRAAGDGLDLREILSFERLPPWFMQVWSLVSLYLALLLAAVLLGGLSGTSGEYVDRLFWSLGNVVIFLAGGLYHHAVLQAPGDV